MVIDTISKEEVDALAKSLLSYLSHYNQEAKVGRPCVQTAVPAATSPAGLPRHGCSACSQVAGAARPPCAQLDCFAPCEPCS